MTPALKALPLLAALAAAPAIAFAADPAPSTQTTKPPAAAAKPDGQASGTYGCPMHDGTAAKPGQPGDQHCMGPNGRHHGRHHGQAAPGTNPPATPKPPA
jgi:hypothetical protein